MTQPAEVNWWVVCIEHASGPYTKAEAAARWADIARDILSCRQDHHLVQSDTEPEPDYPPDGPPTLPATN